MYITAFAIVLRLCIIQFFMIKCRRIWGESNGEKKEVNEKCFSIQFCWVWYGDNNTILYACMLWVHVRLCVYAYSSSMCVKTHAERILDSETVLAFQTAGTMQIDCSTKGLHHVDKLFVEQNYCIVSWITLISIICIVKRRLIICIRIDSRTR